MRRVGDVWLADTATVIGDVTLGAGVNVWFAAVVRGDVAPITLGDRVNLQDGVIVHCDMGFPQAVEAGVVVGHGAILHGVRVGANTLVGMGARLLGGTDVGEDCLIAAGAVVPPGLRVPAGSVVMGVPGRVVRAVTEAEMAFTRVLSARYQEFAARHAAGDFPPPTPMRGRP
jgi:carbonic anhydrase/acetyltransferase-like protein (isoleucine patch superfamily)